MHSHWSEYSYGKFILQQEAKLLLQALQLSAANNAAVICDPPLLELLRSTPLGQNQANLFRAQFSDAHLSDVQNKQNIETGSVDWIILWHSLEQQSEPQALLREVTRALSDGGRVTIIGFNPVRILSRKFWLWKDKCRVTIENELNTFRLNDWFKLLNYDVTQINTLISPTLSRFNKYKDKCLQKEHVNTFPMFGLIYQFEALRRHFPITPLWSGNKKEKKRSLRLVTPATRGRTGKLLPLRDCSVHGKQLITQPQNCYNHKNNSIDINNRNNKDN
jgi:hypothetical protein